MSSSWLPLSTMRPCSRMGSGRHAHRRKTVADQDHRPALGKLTDVLERLHSAAGPGRSWARRRRGSRRRARTLAPGRPSATRRCSAPLPPRTTCRASFRSRGAVLDDLVGARIAGRRLDGVSWGRGRCYPSRCSGERRAGIASSPGRSRSCSRAARPGRTPGGRSRPR